MSIYEYDEFKSCVNRAAHMLSLGFNEREIVIYLSTTVGLEQAYLYLRSAELYLKWFSGP